MKFELHFEYQDGTTDCIIVSGESLEEIREAAKAEVEQRKPIDYWSKQV